MKSKSLQSNKSSFEESIEGKILKQVNIEPNYKLVHGLIAIVKNENHYRIGTGNYLIVEEKFETIQDAERYIKKNNIEVAIRAAVCLSKIINNGN